MAKSQYCPRYLIINTDNMFFNLIVDIISTKIIATISTMCVLLFYSQAWAHFPSPQLVSDYHHCLL